MKKWMVILLCGAIGFGSFGPVMSAQSASATVPIIGSPKLAVLVDGRKVKFQGGDPVTENGHVQVPLRGVGVALGAKLSLDGNKVGYVKEGKSIVLTLGSNVATVNGKNVKMDGKAKAVNGRTYVPLRFISENLGESVSWDKVGNWVWIGSKDVPTPEEAGIKPQSLDGFKAMFGSKKTYMVGKKNVHVFTAADLPLKFKDTVSETIIYDIWKVKQGSHEGIRVRYSRLPMDIFYLTSASLPRGRDAIEKLNNSDGTETLTFQGASQIDDLNGDKNYKSFKISQADFIGFWSGTVSIELLKNPFK